MSSGPRLQMVVGKNARYNVYVQGDQSDDDIAKKTVILTVHDVGTNHNSFVDFFDHPSMADVTANALVLHICLPGQEDNAMDLTFPFPTLAEIGDDLSVILDNWNARSCIAFGEGAGANICCRFALQHANRLAALCLVNCTSTTVGPLEYVKDKIINLRLEKDVMTEGAWSLLTAHKLSTSDKNERAEYIENLKRTINQKNLSAYLLAFSKRTDLSTVLGAKLDTIDTLLVSGSKASHIQSVYATHKKLNKKKSTLLVLDGVHDVMTEAPDNLARSFILHCKGCGVLSQVGVPGMTRQRTLSSSMEQADMPRRLSLTQHKVSISSSIADTAAAVE